MNMLLVGTGAVGETILRALKERDPKGKWLKKVVVSDVDGERAGKVASMLQDSRFIPAELDARNEKDIVALIEKHQCDFVMDAASPFVCNTIFDGAYQGGANYGNMGTFSKPKENPDYEKGLEGCYDLVMADYHFQKEEAWKKAGQMAVICMGIDPGVVDVFARFAADYLFDQLEEVHVKDGGDLHIEDPDHKKIGFGFNVWTVLDECMNPNVEWDKEKGFITEPPFAGEEIFHMPCEVGPNRLVKVEHEETVLMPRYLQKYGLKKCSFKIGLDEDLTHALWALEAIGLRNDAEVQVGNVKVKPRDVVAAVAPQPTEYSHQWVGKMIVGIHCIGTKDGQKREIFLYQPYEQKEAWEKWETQAVVAQTGCSAAIGIEMIGTGQWNEPGVYGPEYFDAISFLKAMKESGLSYGMMEMDSPYKRQRESEDLEILIKEAIKQVSEKGEKQ